MLKATVLFSLLVISSAKILSDPSLDNDHVDVEDVELTNPTWVLKVRSEELELKRASPYEEEEFEENSGPSIDNYLAKSRVRTPRHPAKVNDSFVVDKEDIFRLLNKFTLLTEEPDSYLSETNDDDISLTIFFKNPFTTLVVKVGQKQWHFFIRPISPLPPWFYKNHAQNAGKIPEIVEIPNYVKQRFYVSLWHLLCSMLNEMLIYPL